MRIELTLIKYIKWLTHFKSRLHFSVRRLTKFNFEVFCCLHATNPCPCRAKLKKVSCPDQPLFFFFTFLICCLCFSVINNTKVKAAFKKKKRSVNRLFAFCCCLTVVRKIFEKMLPHRLLSSSSS
jgi:hypothetical protein